MRFARLIKDGPLDSALVHLALKGATKSLDPLVGWHHGARYNISGVISDACRGPIVHTNNLTVRIKGGWSNSQVLQVSLSRVDDNGEGIDVFSWESRGWGWLNDVLECLSGRGGKCIALREFCQSDGSSKCPSLAAGCRANLVQLSKEGGPVVAAASSMDFVRWGPPAGKDPIVQHVKPAINPSAEASRQGGRVS